MSDPNLVDFYGRIARLEKARAKGFAFEAAGTLGRSYYYQKPRKRRSIILPLIFVAISVFGLKGTIHHFVGQASYQERVASLQAGEGFDRLGGWLMQADPVTVLISDQIARIKARFQ